MGLAAYEIIGNDAEWRERHDGKAENTFKTKEAAFEAAVAAASRFFFSAALSATFFRVMVTRRVKHGFKFPAKL